MRKQITNPIAKMFQEEVRESAIECDFRFVNQLENNKIDIILGMCEYWQIDYNNPKVLTATKYLRNTPFEEWIENGNGFINIEYVDIVKRRLIVRAFIQCMLANRKPRFGLALQVAKRIECFDALNSRWFAASVSDFEKGIKCDIAIVTMPFFQFKIPYTVDEMERGLIPEIDL